MSPRRAGGIGSLCAALGLPFEGVFPPNVRIVISPAAPTNLGAGTNEDWLLILNRASTPLVYSGEPTILVQEQQSGAGTGLNVRMVTYAYVTLGVSRRPEGVGIVKGLTAPAY
jgi:hypothetical protein